ncbi:DUF4303 domain-containing protein [Ralstonia solanacearum]|uniref:DUF4303 domain-containing protein n=1 Tax=Ralstonia solanacearum TaxID=305 RepID=UPI0001D95A78|nr:DUF4303 domain-containing protein [Ralstonia solanacearum]CBJ35499.1 conserved hypothethical protein [Ralstonia solanacearum PSI07]
MNFEDLRLKIEVAATEAFELVRKKYPRQIFCGYALYSDADAATVCPAMNSVDHLKRMIDLDPEDAIYYRWSPGEWDHEFKGAECFAEVSNLLCEGAVRERAEHERQAYKEKIYECCVAALESMKTKGFFSEMTESGVLVFSLSNGDSELEANWIARLNGRELADEFRAGISGL